MSCVQIAVRLTAVAALVAAVLAIQNIFSSGGGGTHLLSSAEAQTVSVETGVRISAQRLDDGGVQFGLRAVDSSGEYADPVEPRVNSFNPARVSTGRWLASSSLILEVDESGQGRLVSSEQFEPRPRTESTLVTGVEGWAGDIRYAAYHDADGDLVTTVSVYSAAAGAPDGEVRTTISCRDGETSVTLGGLSSEVGGGVTIQQINVSWSVDGSARASERRAAWPVEGGTELITLGESRLVDDLLGAGSALALSIETTPALATTIDLAALSALPIYDNLVWCATDDATASAHSGHTELRIRAMLRDDERIEFAIQQRTDDGWSDNVLPSSRVMPAFGAATIWLSSTPVSVTVAVEPSHMINAPDPVQRPVAEPIAPVLRSGWRTASLAYSAELDERAKLNSIVAVHGDGDLQLQLGCFSGVRRVQLAGAPADTTGELTLAFDDAQSVAHWNVTASDSSAILRPADTERMIERLRRASSLAVGMAASNPFTFDLTGLFETPIQANIDQCGNYTDPAWHPVTEEQDGTTDVGATYRLSYPEWNDGERFTSVRVPTSGELSDSDGPRIDLVAYCFSDGSRSLQLNNLPFAVGTHAVRSRIDDDTWIERQLRFNRYDDDRSWFAIAEEYEILRDGSALEIEILTNPVWRGSFDLTALFSTPIQANIDNCDEPLWSQTGAYVPIVNVQGQVSPSIAYRVHAGVRIDSVVTNTVDVPVPPETDVMETEAGSALVRQASLEMACRNSETLVLSVNGISAIDGREVDVTLSIDGQMPETSAWRVWRFGDGSVSGVNSPDSARHLAQLRGASSVTVEIPASGLAPLTFDLTGMFETPVQDNIDECGYYKPGETRGPPPPLNTSGSTQGINGDATVIEWIRQLAAGSIPETVIRENVLSDSGPFLLGLQAYCGGAGARLLLAGTQLAELSGETVPVEWSVDDASAVTESWALSSSGPFGILTPTDPRAAIAVWRDGALLDVTIQGAQPIEQRFDLGVMFNAPVVDTLDQCLTLPLPTWDTPVEGIEHAVEDNLVYGADERFSTWTLSLLRLRVPTDAAAESAGTSSQLEMTCGIEGIGAVVSSIGGVYITSDTVEVTWRVGQGLPQTATWDAWLPPTGGGTYSISPQDDAAFFAAINGSDSLSMSVASDPVFTETYDLAGNGFWSTPVQPNLDACGGS